MGKVVYTDEMRQLVTDNYIHLSNAELVNLFNNTFKSTYMTVSRMSSLKSRMNLRKVIRKTPESISNSGVIQPMHYNFIRDNSPNMTNKELIESLKLEFGIDVTMSMIKHYKGVLGVKGRTNGQFKKGRSPWNKGLKINSKPNSGQFKKGHTLSNSIELGGERYKNNILYVKVAHEHNGKKWSNWKAKHIILWEEAYGEVPEGHVLVFRNRNKNDIRLENLMCLTRSESMVYHSKELATDDPMMNEIGLEIARLIIAKNKYKNGAAK